MRIVMLGWEFPPFIAGGLGVKLAHPRSPVAVLVGDGSYLMQNSEIASSVALGAPLVIVVLDNRGFGCIDRLSRATGSGTFNNLLEDRAPRVDFAAHAASLGAMARHVPDVAALEGALPAAFAARRTTVLVIATDPIATTQAGGAWWDVPVAATNTKLRRAYDRARAAQSRIN